MNFVFLKNDQYLKLNNLLFVNVIGRKIIEVLANKIKIKTISKLIELAKNKNIQKEINETQTSTKLLTVEVYLSASRVKTLVFFPDLPFI